jgi:hypothetical protein
MKKRPISIRYKMAAILVLAAVVFLGWSTLHCKKL